MRILVGLINGMIAGATPILLAALGGAFTFYAGIFNIAMEGMMLAGAFGAVVGAYFLHSWVLGIVLSIGFALVLALIFILFSVVLHTDEFVTGIALNLFAVGATTYLMRQTFDVKGVFSNAGIVPIPRIHIPLIEQIPFLGDVLSGQNLMVYIAVIAVIAVNFVIFRTRFGMRLRAAGYNAACLDSSGVSTARMRTWALLLCAVLCGLAGAFLSLGYVTLFAENMSAGRGWISLAAI
ncbi:ABC transporter permease, partial [bacterium]